MNLPPIVIDLGSGFTKLGCAGNMDPTFVLPTAMQVRQSSIGRGRPSYSSTLGILDDLDFTITDDIVEKPGYCMKYPIRYGLVEDWDAIERYLGRCMFDFMKCNPDDHLFLMTESPVGGPESRENLAEIMFETYNVAGLYIAEQAFFSLIASGLTNPGIGGADFTGTVVDCGDGVTHVIPVVDGFVIGSCVRRMPICGRDITLFIQGMIRDREFGVPPEQSMETARNIKETLCYVCPDLVTEFGRYDNDLERRYVRQYEALNNVSKQPFRIEVGYERFLAPEIFFHPEFVNAECLKSLAVIVDEVVQSCPTDVRRSLYKNIILSGGSSLFKDFGKRLKRDIQIAINRRQNEAETGAVGDVKSQPIEVKVISHPMHKYAAWLGGSLYANTPVFVKACHTRTEYDEKGPGICRQNLVGPYTSFP